MRIEAAAQGAFVGRCAGAGILGYCCPPGGSDVYFVLGKERDCPSWRYGSNRWSDFAGGGKDDECPEATAAREFLEETLAVVPWQEDGGGICDVDGLAAALLRREFAARIVMSIQGGDQPPKHHVTYVKRIPWCPGAPGDFERARRELLSLHRASEGASASMRCAEAALRDHGVELPSSAYSRPRSAVRAHASDEGGEGRLDLSGWWSREAASEGQESVHPDTACCALGHDTETLRAADAYERAVRRWDEAAHRLQCAPADVAAHPAVRAEIAPDGAVLTFRVSPDYLEKQSMQLWSRTRLEEVVRGTGYFRGEHFRPCFLPTLAVTLDWFGGDCPSGDSDALVRALTAASPTSSSAAAAGTGGLEVAGQRQLVHRASLPQPGSHPQSGGWCGREAPGAP